MHIYDTQSDGMHSFHPKHSTTTINSPKKRSLNRDFLNFIELVWYNLGGTGESSCLDSSEYVWQRGVGDLLGPVTGGRS